MRVIIINNGLAGTIVPLTLHEADREVKIDIFAQEKYREMERYNFRRGF